MNAKIIVVFMIIALSFFVPTVAGIGISPPQLRLTEAPMSENRRVASIAVTNTGTEPDYIVFQIGCLAKTREHKLRVICNGCGRDIGIQRGDLIDDACPFCGNSTALIFYDFTPDEILDNITLGCSSHPLERKGNRQYYTVDELQPGESAEVDIYVDIPDSEAYYNKHWEARIMATSVDDVEDISDLIVYGVETKFLIDTQTLSPEEPVKEEDFAYMFLGIGLAGGAVGIVVIAVFVKATKKDVLIDFPDEAKKAKPKSIKRGRKIL